jgi:hypothetical protein
MADLRDQIADFIAGEPLGPGGLQAIMAKVAERFPAATEADVDAGLDRAIEIIEERAERNANEADALTRIAPLFDGMPDGMPLEECARIKAERGDPLAISFLEWMKQQAGGVQ